MPTYQYACTACDHRFEAVQSFSDAALTDCPECDSRLRKVFSSVGVVFKGSGFYRTDSRSDGKGGSSKSSDTKGSSKSTESSSTSSTSSESKGTSAKSTDAKASSSSTSSSTSAA